MMTLIDEISLLLLMPLRRRCRCLMPLCHFDTRMIPPPASGTLPISMPID